MQAFTTDVLIVGAGPAGLATAIGLAQKGVRFLIVDALPEAQNTSRAAVIHAATLESLGALGVAGQLIEQGIQASQFKVRDRDKILLHVNFALLPGSRPYALIIPQDESEAILIRRLSELGHTVVRPARLAQLEIQGNAVQATLDGAHSSFTVSARYIVGADGEKSTVRSSVGIDFPGHTYGSFLLADVHMDWSMEKSEVSLFFSDSGALIIAPMSRNRYRVVAQQAETPAEPGVADVQRLIDERGPRHGARVQAMLWGSRFQVHHKLAAQFRKGPVLLVGDAAHVHSPAGGQGMNLGLRDAEVLSRCLADALRSGADNSLSIYAVERRVAAREVLSMTHRLTYIATLRRPLSRWVRNEIITLAGCLPSVRRYVACKLAGFK